MIEKKKLTWQFSTVYIAKIAILSTIAYILYTFAKFPMPLIFPSWLDMQFSELPALLAGFSMGPISGCMVVLLKGVLKIVTVGSSTAFAGELTDILTGIMFVLPASLIYMKKKNRKSAFIGLFVGSILFVIGALVVNRFVSVPIFIELFFEGSWEPILGMTSVIYPDVNVDNFYTFYLGLGVLPFNLLRCLIISVVTFFLYKRLSKILKWNVDKIKNNIQGEFVSLSVDDTNSIAKKIADTLCGNEIIILEGDLGAGKTTFTKALAKALEIEEMVTSPTFTILNIYESGRLRLNHLDMYRLETEDDLVELGIEEAITENGVTVIEWNKYENLTGRIIDVKIEYVEDDDIQIEKVEDSAIEIDSVEDSVIKLESVLDNDIEIDSVVDNISFQKRKITIRDNREFLDAKLKAELKAEKKNLKKIKTKS